MVRIRTLCLLLFGLFTLFTSALPAQTPARVLFVVTSNAEVNGHPNGTYLKELAVTLHHLTEYGYAIDIVSPKGGAVPLYHKGDTSDILATAIANPIFQTASQNSLRPGKARAKNYAAVIIPGGYGQFWDVHENEKLLKLIRDIHARGGVAGSLGHGTSTFVRVKTPSGAPFAKGKTMGCFPSLYEKGMLESNRGELLPFDMEVELKKQGADLKVYDNEKKINYEIVDEKNRLVTATFAGSGDFVAREVDRLIQNLAR